MKYELDDLDRDLIEKLRLAIEEYDNGTPIKDYLDEYDLVEAARLLLLVIDSEQEEDYGDPA